MFLHGVKTWANMINNILLVFVIGNNISNRLNSNKCAKENLTRRNGVTSIDNRKSVKFSCTIKHETKRAILVEHEDQKCWLPKSVVQIDNLKCRGLNSRVVGHRTRIGLIAVQSRCALA